MHFFVSNFSLNKKTHSIGQKSATFPLVKGQIINSSNLLDKEANQEYYADAYIVREQKKSTSFDSFKM